jgi:hypothetical protein
VQVLDVPTHLSGKVLCRGGRGEVIQWAYGDEGAREVAALEKQRDCLDL